MELDRRRDTVGQMGDAVADPVDELTMVVATDGSAASNAALDWAIREAAGTGRRLALVYVLTVPDELATALLPLAGAPEAATFGQEVLQRAAWRCREAGVPHSTQMVEGTPTQRLLEVAVNAGMLVLGGHHHDAPPPPAMESVIQGCLHRCRCPFVLVKPPAGDIERS